MEKPTVKLIGEDGNIFNLLSIVRRSLREKYKESKDEEYNTIWQNISSEVFDAKSYDEALGIITKYLNVV